MVLCSLRPTGTQAIQVENGGYVWRAGTAAQGVVNEISIAGTIYNLGGEVEWGQPHPWPSWAQMPITTATGRALQHGVVATLKPLRWERAKSVPLAYLK